MVILHLYVSAVYYNNNMLRESKTLLRYLTVTRRQSLSPYIAFGHHYLEMEGKTLISSDFSAIKDRIEGLLIGIAAGDRNGGPILMAEIFARSLLKFGNYLRDDVLAGYLRWYEHEGFDTGPIADTVFTLILQGKSFADATKEAHTRSGGMSAGVNPAHRSTVLAMAMFLSDSAVAEAARRDALLTHFDPLAGDVAAASVMICRSLIRSGDWSEALQCGCTATKDHRTKSAFNVVSSVASLDRGGFAPKTLQAALHFVGAASSFSEAIATSVNFAGSANYCPVLVGAFAGARWGRKGIDSESLAHCKSTLVSRLSVTAYALSVCQQGIPTIIEANWNQYSLKAPSACTVFALEAAAQLPEKNLALLATQGSNYKSERHSSVSELIEKVHRYKGKLSVASLPETPVSREAFYRIMALLKEKSPKAAILVKPPETIMITHTGDSILIFDSHPRHELRFGNHIQAAFVSLVGADQAVEYLLELFPTVDLEDSLTSSELNLFQLHLVSVLGILETDADFTQLPIE